MVFILLVAGACKCNRTEKSQEDAPPGPTLESCLNTSSYLGKADIISSLIDDGLFAEALECAKTGDSGEILTTIKNILRALDSAPAENVDRLSLLSNMLELTKSLDNMDQKKEAIGEIIKALSKASPNESRLDDFVKRMIEALDPVHDPSSLYWPIMDICELIKGADNNNHKRALFGSVLKFINTIENPQSRWEPVKNTAIAMAQNGLFDEAIVAAEIIEDQDFKDWAISNIAVEIAKAGTFEKALETTRIINGGMRKGEAINGIIAELAIVEEPENKINLLKTALEIAQTIFDPSWAKHETIGKIAVAMARHGFFDEALATAQGMDVPDSIVYRDIAVEMVRAGRNETEISNTIKQFFDLLKIRDWNSASANHNKIESIDATILLENYRSIVPILVNLLATQTTEINPWYSRNTFDRPRYEVAMVIGLIAKEARRNGNAEALQFIKTNALPKIIELLHFSRRYSRNRGADFFNTYVLLPMRMTLLEVLVNIGDASVIPEISELKDDLYHLSCGFGHCGGRKPIHTNKAKELTINYLQTQASNSEYLVPPCLFNSEDLIDWK